MLVQAVVLADPTRIRRTLWRYLGTRLYAVQIEIGSERFAFHKRDFNCSATRSRDVELDISSM